MSKEKKINLDIPQQILMKDLLEFRITLEKKRNFSNKILSLFSKSPQQKFGFYIYGKVGRGKTAIMNMFYDTVDISNKLKIHFHQFMQQVHHKIHIKRTLNPNDDPIKEVAKDLSKKYFLICLDELFIDNIVDAMIVGRLFENLLDLGINLIITSNTYPEELYRNGLQRENFVKFIQLIMARLEIKNLDGPIDYRKNLLKDKELYLYPANEANNLALWNLFQEMAKGQEIKEVSLEIQNRKITFTTATSKILFTNFTELCERYLWVSEYLEIAKRFDIVFIQNIPQYNENKKNEFTRFSFLIDILYENKVILITTLQEKLDNLFRNNPNFARTESRLIEMQSKLYYEGNI